MGSEVSLNKWNLEEREVRWQIRVVGGFSGIAGDDCGRRK